MNIYKVKYLLSLYRIAVENESVGQLYFLLSNSISASELSGEALKHSVGDGDDTFNVSGGGDGDSTDFNLLEFDFLFLNTIFFVIHSLK